MNYEELVQNHASEMIEKLLTELMSKDTIEVHFDYEDNDQWSVVSMHIYEEDKEISLRLRSEDRFELALGYYDDEDEFLEITKALTDEEKKAIPKGLQKAITKVLVDEQGLRLPGNFLSR